MLFEAFGFRYIGPIDGHDLPTLIQALENAKLQDIPVIVHCHTVKGKGYEPAEEDPILWHGVVPFDRNRGEFKASTSASTTKKLPSYTGVFADTVTQLAKKDPSVVAITAAMPSGTGLDKTAKEVPQQVYDVGICEQHAVTYAAGLACEGFKPIVAIYSTFLQRAYDQVIHDVCIQKLPVIFALDRGGVVGNDGETHQGVFDIAYLRTIPQITIMSPKDENELQHMLHTAVELGMPAAIRYPRGNGTGVELDAQLQQIPIGKSEVLRDGGDALLIGFGPIVHNALQAAKVLSRDHSIECKVVNARFAKPLDTQMLRNELPKFDLVCTIEDHALAGGFGSAVLESANELGLNVNCAIKCFGIGDAFVPHASQSEQHKLHGYDVESIAEYVLRNMKARRRVA
jgi:1-deoxy-D-xylulose-5-phosphate synthase